MVNQHCCISSLTKIRSNSNASNCIDARAVFYAMHHTNKPNQQEEASEYKKVLEFTQKCFYEQRHKIEISESLSRIIGATFANTTQNVISPWLAKYLICNKSRSLSSHVSTIIPVQDIESELFGNGSKYSYVKSHGQNKFIDSKALHSLYCPTELEDISCEFTSGTNTVSCVVEICMYIIYQNTSK
jgi:hypothetical protein